MARQAVGGIWVVVGESGSSTGPPPAVYLLSLVVILSLSRELSFTTSMAHYSRASQLIREH